MRRLRGLGRRFLIANKVIEIKKTKRDSREEGNNPQETLVKGTPSSTSGSSTKRKANTGTSIPNKNIKIIAAPTRYRRSAKDEDKDKEDDADNNN
jgi:hypothetical protein